MLFSVWLISEGSKVLKANTHVPDFTTCCLGEGTKDLCYFLNRYMSQVMRLKFTRDSHLRRFNRLLSYNLPRELEMLKYVPTQTFDAHMENMQTGCYATDCKGAFHSKKRASMYSRDTTHSKANGCASEAEQ